MFLHMYKSIDVEINIFHVTFVIHNHGFYIFLLLKVQCSGACMSLKEPYVICGKIRSRCFLFVYMPIQ